MKKKLSMLLCAVLAVSALTACGNSTPAPEQEPVAEERQELWVNLDASMFGGLTYDEKDMNGNIVEGWAGCICVTGYEGQTLGEVLEAQEFRNLAGVSDNGDELEGWLVYRENTVEDEDGFTHWLYERVTDRLYTTEELMALPLEEDNLTYMAKWAGVSDEEYVLTYETVVEDEDPYNDYYLSIVANGGEAFRAGDGEDDGFAMGGYAMMTGASMAEIMDGPIVEMKKDGAVFAGWNVYTSLDYDVFYDEEPGEVGENDLLVDMDQWGSLVIYDCQTLGEKVSLEDFNNLCCEEMHYFAIAQWN